MGSHGVEFSIAWCFFLRKKKGKNRWIAITFAKVFEWNNLWNVIFFLGLGGEHLVKEIPRWWDLLILFGCRKSRFLHGFLRVGCSTLVACWCLLYAREMLYDIAVEGYNLVFYWQTQNIKKLTHDPEKKARKMQLKKNLACLCIFTSQIP